MDRKNLYGKWKRKGNYWVKGDKKVLAKTYPGSKKSYPPNVKTLSDILDYDWQKEKVRIRKKK